MANDNDGLDGYRQELREEIEEHRSDVQEQLRETRLAQQQLNEKMDEVLVAVGSVHEVMNAWNNAKGFVNTVQMISKVIKFLTPIGLLILAGWYFIKTGHLPPSK